MSPTIHDLGIDRLSAEDRLRLIGDLLEARTGSGAYRADGKGEESEALGLDTRQIETTEFRAASQYPCCSRQ